MSKGPRPLRSRRLEAAIRGGPRRRTGEITVSWGLAACDGLKVIELPDVLGFAGQIQADLFEGLAHRRLQQGGVPQHPGGRRETPCAPTRDPADARPAESRTPPARPPRRATASPPQPTSRARQAPEAPAPQAHPEHPATREPSLPSATPHPPPTSTRSHKKGTVPFLKGLKFRQRRSLRTDNNVHAASRKTTTEGVSATIFSIEGTAKRICSWIATTTRRSWGCSQECGPATKSVCSRTA